MKVTYGCSFFLYSSWQTGRNWLHLQPYKNWGRRRTLPEYLCKLAGCFPPCYLSVIHQHSAGQPTHCYVQVPTYFTSIITSQFYTAGFVSSFLYLLSAATPFPKCRGTVTSTGSFNVTTSLWSTTQDPAWHHLLS